MLQNYPGDYCCKMVRKKLADGNIPSEKIFDNGIHYPDDAA
jgi:hypothetical protein